MQAAGSFPLIAAFVGIATLAIALGVIIAAPIVAVPFFVLGFPSSCSGVASAVPT